MSEQYVLVFDHRSDDGPHVVGPFPSRDAAFDSVPKGITASYEAWPMVAPDPKP